MPVKFVVAIGYSEGGLEPLLKFFDQVPHDQATYIILRHIPIGQRGVLGEILKQHSKLGIKEAKDGQAIEKDLVYIPPSESYLLIKDDVLYLRKRSLSSENYNFSINTFLQSLAQDKGDRAIAVILSGTGIDGVAGIIQIKKAGGLVIVQHPNSCIFSELPENAIATGSVGAVLLPAEMPPFITRYVHPILQHANLLNRLKG